MRRCISSRLVFMATLCVAACASRVWAAPSTSFTLTDNPGAGDGVRTDHFDFSQGARIYNNNGGASATIVDMDSLRAIIGEAMSGTNLQNDIAYFVDGQPIGTVGRIYLKTASPITLSSFELRTSSDAAGSTVRGITKVQFWGSLDNITWTDYGSTNIALPYTGNPGVSTKDLLVTGTVSGAIPAQFYRFDVTYGSTSGPRMRELDGFGTIVSCGDRTVRDPIVFNASDNGPSSHVYDEDPGYASSISGTPLYNAGENVREVFGAYYASGVWAGGLIFSDTGTADDGDQDMDDGDTIDHAQWDTTADLPTDLAGLRVGVNVGDRKVQLLRFSTNGVAVTLSGGSTIYDTDAAAGAVDLMFEEPITLLSGTTCKLELTRDSNGPRLQEIDAILSYAAPPARGTVFTFE